MNSLQYYIDKYHSLSEGLGITGDTAEVLSQLLGNATYISEVEHVVYNQEASLEKAVLMNSKIQHCMEDMYSVFRGKCPRVIMKIIPTTYLEFNLFDEIYVGSNFKVYYSGYYVGDEIVHSSISIPPSLGDETYTISGFISPGTVISEFTTTTDNPYWVESLEEDLSCDLWYKQEGSYVEVTREFARHLMDGYVFDLTLPSFGSRLYLPSPSPNTEVEVCWYKYSLISSYNQNELKKISIRGAQMVGDIELIPESPRDTLSTIHYRANKDRYMNSILRVNQDIGLLLEEAFPEKIRISGTSWVFDSTEVSSSLKIYYIPEEGIPELTEQEISEFLNSRRAYYVTKDVTIIPGTQYKANLQIDLELYQASSVDEEVGNILQEYAYKFRMNLSEKSEEIRALISKISNVKQILSLQIIYLDSSGNVLSDEAVENLLSSLESKYFVIESTLSSIIQTKLL